MPEDAMTIAEMLAMMDVHFVEFVSSYKRAFV
jgi:hypothetical protein